MRPPWINYTMTAQYFSVIFQLIPQHQRPDSLQSVNNPSDLHEYTINLNVFLFVLLASKELCCFAPVGALAQSLRLTSKGLTAKGDTQPRGRGQQSLLMQVGALILVPQEGFAELLTTLNNHRVEIVRFNSQNSSVFLSSLSLNIINTAFFKILLRQVNCN